MSKKQIKELVIQTTSKGTKEVVSEVTSLNEALKGAVTASDALTNSMKGGAKYIGQIATAYANVSKSIHGSVDAVKKLNTALNGDTKKATQSISAYLDNLQILNLELNSTSVSANKAANALGRMTNASQLDKVISLLEDLTSETGHVVVGLETLNSVMNKIETNTGKTSARLKQARDNISEVGVFANRTNEELGELGSRIQTTGERTDKARKHTDLYNNSLRRLNATGSSSARAFSSLAFGMNPLVSTYAAIAVNVYALTEAFRLLKDASSLDRLTEQSAQFSASLTGINVKQLASDMQEASGYSYALGESMRQSVRGVSYGFTSKELLELTEGARKASVALGIDFTDAMDRVIRGISKQEVELLDELGVVTRLDTAFAKYAATLGKTGDQLTDIERRTALTNEVLAQLGDKYKAFDVGANSLERLGTATKNLVDKTLIRLSRALDGAALTTAKFLESLGPVSTKSSLAAENLKIYNEAVASGNTNVATVALYNYQQAMLAVGTAADDSGKKVTEALENQEKVTTILTASTVALGAAMVLAVAKVLAFTTGISLASTIAWGLNAAFAALGSALTFVAGLFTTMSVGALAIWTLGIGAAVIAVTTLLDQFGLLDSILEVLDTALTNFIETWKEVGSVIYEYGFRKTGIEDATKKLLGFNKELANTKLNYIELRREAPWEDIKSLNISNSLGTSGAGSTPGSMMIRQITAEEAALADATNKYKLGLKNSTAAVQALGVELNYSKTKMQELAAAANNLVPPGKKLTNPEDIREAEKFFNSLKDAGYIARDTAFEAGKGLADWAARVDKAASSLALFERSRATQESVFSSRISGSQDADIKELEYSISLNNKALAAQAGLGKQLNQVERDRLLNSNEVLSARIEELQSVKRILATERELEVISAQLSANAEIYGTSQATILQQEKAILLANRAKLVEEKKSTENLDQKIRLLDVEIAKQKQLEAIEMRLAGLDIALQNQQAITAKAGTEQARVVSLEKELALKKAQIEANTKLEASERARQLNSISLEQASIMGMKEGAAFKDASNVLGNIAGLEGLTDLQSTFAGSMSSISDTYSKFLTDMEGKGGSFMDYLTNNIDGMSNVLSSSLSLAQAAFSQISDAKIASIDAEIEAEKRRDGKSEESLAKIKKLQAQKIKEEAKAKKASVGMSTATAIMQAMAQIPFPGNIAMAAAIGAMGMMQMSNVDKAANGQLAALNGASSGLSISGGNRSNEIDVSRRANAGELAYLQGASGTGTASNFMPGKAVGGYSSAGTSIVVGESGPEVITPAVPVNVTPAGQSGSPIQITLSPVFNTSTVDSSGFEQLTQRYSRELYEGLERELRARNRTLDNL